MLFVLLVRDMLGGPAVSELLCKSKIDHIDKMCGVVDAHDKVGRFDVSMDEVAGVDEFNTVNLQQGY